MLAGAEIRTRDSQTRVGQILFDTAKTASIIGTGNFRFETVDDSAAEILLSPRSLLELDVPVQIHHSAAIRLRPLRMYTF